MEDFLLKNSRNCLPTEKARKRRMIQGQYDSSNHDHHHARLVFFSFVLHLFVIILSYLDKHTLIFAAANHPVVSEFTFYQSLS